MKTISAVSAAVAAMASTTAGLAVYGNRRLQRRLTATKRELGAVQASSLRDTLTGLANRAGVNTELARRARAGKPYALFLIDLDGFKPVNDTYGHPVGDQVLTEVGRRLAEGAAFDGDLVGRLGGDEFLLIAASTGPVFAAGFQAPAVLDAVRQPIFVGNVRVQVTASVGLLQVLPGDDLDDAMRSVDAAMYRAKEAGRDQAADFGPRPQTPLITATDRPVRRLRDVHSHRSESPLLLIAGVNR